MITNRYLAWHPIDHIRWELAHPAPGGGAGEGARFHIVEQWGRPEYRVDLVERVEKLDETGIRLVHRIAGLPVAQLEHIWSAGSDGAHYVSILEIGVRTPLLSQGNRIIAMRRMPDPWLQAWVRHNVEEVGQLEHLLPNLPG